MSKMIATLCGIGALLVGTSTCAAQANGDSNESLTMLVGTYTSGTSEGMYSFRFNQVTGEATPLSAVAIGNPSYLTSSANGQCVYAVSEWGDQRAAVTAFAFDKESGVFQKLNMQPTGGADPCYISTNDQMVVAANYSGGSVSVFPLDQAGKLKPPVLIQGFKGEGADRQRQEKPHLHCVQFSPDGRYLFANDLGTDRIYRFDVTNQLETPLVWNASATVEVQAGSGPRHLVFAPNGKWAYLINELSGTVIAFNYQNGALSPIQTVVADTVQAKGSADIQMSPDGAFLYASNRLKADGIAVFSVNPQNGLLTKVGYQLTGIHPRNFNMTPNGKFLLVACRDSQVIQVFKRDSQTGLLTDTKQDIRIDKPVCIKWVE